MTNFAACRSKRSFKTQNLIYLETHSRIVGQSVLGNHSGTRSPLQPNGKTSECGTSIYSGYSSSTLNSRASNHSRQAVGHQQHRSAINGKQCAFENCCCSIRGDRRQSGQTSVISSSYLSSEKCGLCKVKFNGPSREEYLCGKCGAPNYVHFTCLMRFEKLNPQFNKLQCPKNCYLKKMVRTKSIESNSSLRSSSSSASSSSD